MAASGFVQLNDKHFLAEAAISQVCIGGTEEEPTVCVHMAHGTQDFAGDEAIALVEHFGVAHKAKKKAPAHAHAHAK